MPSTPLTVMYFLIILHKFNNAFTVQDCKHEKENHIGNKFPYLLKVFLRPKKLSMFCMSVQCTWPCILKVCQGYKQPKPIRILSMPLHTILMARWRKPFSNKGKLSSYNIQWNNDSYLWARKLMTSNVFCMLASEGQSTEPSLLALCSIPFWDPGAAWRSMMHFKP